MPKFTTGFMLVEVVITTSIIVSSLLVLIAVAQKSISLSRQSLERGEASFILEEGAEAMKIIRDNAWTNISGLTAGTTYYLSWNGTTWSTTTTASSIGNFTRTVVVAAVNRDSSDDIALSGTADSGTKKITITVSWPLGDSTTLSKTVSFYVSDIWS